MQPEKKKIILASIATTIKRLRKNKTKSQFMLGAEYDIAQSVLSELERGTKDPQLTTLLKLSKAFGLSISGFMAEFEKDLPNDFIIGEE